MKNLKCKGDHRSYSRTFCSCKKESMKKKNSGLYGIRTLDLCDTSAQDSKIFIYIELFFFWDLFISFIKKRQAMKN